MHDLETAHGLLIMAGKDLRVLEILAAAEEFPEEAFGFHAQQAVEKTLKAWLALNGHEPPRTHSLRILIISLEKCGEDVSDLWDFAELSPFSVQFRYETFPGIESSLDCMELMQKVQKLVERVEGRRQSLEQGT